MGISETARAKAQASVSEAQAAVTKISADLAEAKKRLESADTAGDMLDSMKDVALLGSITSGMRDKAEVDEAQLHADVDRLTAELSAAQDKLDLARTAQHAVEAVVGDGESKS